MQLSIVTILAVIGSTYSLPLGSLLDSSLGVVDDLVSKAGVSVPDDFGLGDMEFKLGNEKAGLSLAVHTLGQQIDGLESSAKQIKSETSQTDGAIADVVDKNEDIANRLAKITDKLEKLPSSSGSQLGSQGNRNPDQNKGYGNNRSKSPGGQKSGSGRNGQISQGYRTY